MPQTTGETPVPQDVILLDSAGRLSRWRLALLRRFCRRRGWGLLVTAHQRLGLPLLLETRVDAPLARQIVEAVLAQSPDAPPLVSPDDVASALAACEGNMREALFRLYDVYEANWNGTANDLHHQGTKSTKNSRNNAGQGHGSDDARNGEAR